MPYTGPTPYKGETVRGVNYGPTWPDWTRGAPNSQTWDSDFVNDAFQSLWSNQYEAPPPGDKSGPHKNPFYRNDLEHISTQQVWPHWGFNLVRPYDWNMSRGASSKGGPALGHINFLKRAHALKLKVVVPISDYFLSDDQYAWNGQSPDKITASSYSFSSAPEAIQTDLNLFISSITDPATRKIHACVQSISVGNEGDLGEGGLASKTRASQFLARTIWWIHNLHLKFPAIPLSATISNADQNPTGSTGSYWFKCFIDGVKQGQATPLGCNLGIWDPEKEPPKPDKTFTATVPGLKEVDSDYDKFYYNSVNISQTSAKEPYNNTLKETLNLYDSWQSKDGGWPGARFDVPLMLMEVFTPNRDEFPSPQDQNQAEAAVKQVKAMEEYLKDNKSGGPQSTTQFMGYNYFEFNDEPAKDKQTGLFKYLPPVPPGATASTGTTAVWFEPYGPGRGHFIANVVFPYRSLTALPGPSGSRQTSLIAAIQALFPTGPRPPENPID